MKNLILFFTLALILSSCSTVNSTEEKAPTTDSTTITIDSTVTEVQDTTKN